jgi:predicted nucleotidyltransferase
VNESDLYLHAVINRHRASADDGRPSRLRRRVEGLLRHWRFGGYLEWVRLSGSWVKSTALRDSDVDVFLSLAPDTPGALTAIHASLAEHFRDYIPRPRNVSLRIRLDGSTVNLVPGRRRAGSPHHTLWQLRYNTWLQTDIAEQIRYVRSAGLATETLALKLWRRRHVLRFPSFLLELSVIQALSWRANRTGGFPNFC